MKETMNGKSQYELVKRFYNKRIFLLQKEIVYG